MNQLSTTDDRMLHRTPSPGGLVLDYNSSEFSIVAQMII